VLYVLNNGATDQAFNIKSGSNYVTPTVKANSVATFVWAAAAPPTVALAAQPSGLDLPKGQSGSVNLAITPLAGTPSVTLTCQVLDAQDNPTTDYNCAAGQTNFTFTDGNPKSTTITVTPTQTSGVIRNSKGPWRFAALSLFSGMPLLGLVFFGGGKKRRAATALMLLSMIALALTSCGGGGGSSTTPPPAPTPTAATPTFSPVGGTYTSTQNVTIASSTVGGTIYYTTDGTTPTASAIKYTAPIAVSATKTIKAMASASGYLDSAVATAAYTIFTNYIVVITGATDTGSPVVLRLPLKVN
jgi:hypothetical protein